jgi:hypothetical protein
MADQAFLGRGWAFPPTLDATGEIALVAGDEDVHQALRIILGTSLGERAMRGDYGAGLEALAFEPLSTSTIATGRLDISIDYRVRSTNVFYNLVYPYYLIEGGEPR